METYGGLRLIALVLVWGIPTLLVLAVAAFIIVAPALTFGGMASKLGEGILARRARAVPRQPVPNIGEMLGATAKKETRAAQTGTKD